MIIIFAFIIAPCEIDKIKFFNIINIAKNRGKGYSINLEVKCFNLT